MKLSPPMRVACSRCRRRCDRCRCFSCAVTRRYAPHAAPTSVFTPFFAGTTAGAPSYANMDPDVLDRSTAYWAHRYVVSVPAHARTHARTHAHTHTRTHALTHARTHERTHERMHARTLCSLLSGLFDLLCSLLVCGDSRDRRKLALLFVFFLLALLQAFALCFLQARPVRIDDDDSRIKRTE